MAVAGNGLAVGVQVASRFQLADDLIGRVARAFHGGVPSPVWPVEDSCSRWKDFPGPRQIGLTHPNDGISF